MIISGGLMGSLGYNPQGTTKRVSGFFSCYTGMMYRVGPGSSIFLWLAQTISSAPLYTARYLSFRH